MGPVSRAAWSIGEFLIVAIVINAVTVLGTCEADWSAALSWTATGWDPVADIHGAVSIFL